ncbi:flagellar biosynthesis anti-sigma factor FlgM [Robinsoniella peoriensis]|uniref:flagellar biosynthesis anti-sigma factor FlgM n=1 Tax=Robinsoniella peoriensis TaxID=180332 RepID=UPI00085C5AD5|nr:flagellar biosynthesis anti-sigma factor FlgM [Robinsoniella peoriensis]
MEMKISRNYSVYQKALNTAKETEKFRQVSRTSGSGSRNDEILISGEGLKRQEASMYASKLGTEMEKAGCADKVERIRQQFQSGTYQINVQDIARRLLSGI